MMIRYVCILCNWVFLAEGKPPKGLRFCHPQYNPLCPKCGKKRVFRARDLVIDWFYNIRRDPIGKILSDSFLYTTREEQEDIIAFYERMDYPLPEEIDGRLFFITKSKPEDYN